MNDPARRQLTRLRELEQRLAGLERQKLELEERDRRKDDFLAVLSHEMRTPLGAIVNWVEVLRGRSVDAATIEHGLGAIERSVRQQARMIDDLLDISRITAGKVSLVPQNCDLAAIVRSAIEVALPTAAHKPVSLECQIDVAEVPLRGDPTRLQQVVGNLVSNAIKFTPAGGRVALELRASERHAEILVHDTGQGIAPDFLPYVFDRFRQAANRPRRSSGLGLGLAIAKHLVEMHGGTIDAESPGDGLGATFRVRVPLRDAAQPSEAVAAHPATPDRAHRSLANVGVLLVDDDADAAVALVRLLEREGAIVRDARSLAEALALFREHRPRVVLTDVLMPDGEVDQIVAAFRAVERDFRQSQPASIVALTASARSEDRRRVAAAGFALHLTKPVDPSEVVEAVAMCVDGRTQEYAAERRARKSGVRFPAGRLKDPRPPAGPSSEPSKG